MLDGYGNKIETVASVTEALTKARDREARDAYQTSIERSKKMTGSDLSRYPIYHMPGCNCQICSAS